MKRSLILLAFFALCGKGVAQELFVFTEPASNMATNSFAVRILALDMEKRYERGRYRYVIPEIMYGINQKFMLNVNAFLSNYYGDLEANGGSVYAKYKFLNHDEVQQHFRMAAFARYSFNNTHIHQEELNLYANNSGFETGVIATQLLHRWALSSSASVLKATSNGAAHEFPFYQSSIGTNYTLSVGKLVLPKTYQDYVQTNVNIMCEFLGQTLLPNGRTYLDIAPSIQFILNSKARIDVAYRQELFSNMRRTAPNGFLVRLEYNFFNAF